MVQPFLSVVTRTHPRPVDFLALNADSLRVQVDQDYEHIVLRDEVGRGLAWANAQFYANREKPTGKYVIMLDDDNVFCTPHAITVLKMAAWDMPELVLFRAVVGPHGILPDGEAWAQRQPIAFRIDGHCCMVRADVWREHVAAFAQERMGDVAFFGALFAAGVRSEWINMVLVRALAVGSLGWQAEEVA